MPKTIKLSWQPGVGNREGRWRKIYRGKAYHFDGGNGKSDREGYDAAWAAWEALKAKIDQTAPRKHQGDYEQCIGQWEKVLAWSSQYEDKEYAQQAERKLVDLRRRFAAVKLTPLTRSDWFESLFDRPAVEENPIAQAVLAQMERDLGPSRLPPVDLSSIEPFLDSRDGSPRRIEREVWRDRLAMQERKAAPEDESLGAHIKMFLSQKETQVSTGELSVGRVYTLRLHLEGFRDWQGTDTNVKDVDGAVLLRYKAHLSKNVASGDWSLATAAHCLGSVKSFVRWLYETNAIVELPRALAIKSKSLTISVPEPPKVTLSKDEIKALLKDAKDRVKLYVLLSLNCSFTEKDIGDLLVSEVRWDEGRIIRKRSKTKDEKNVPIVDYKLWPETLRLLKQEAAEGSERVLLNNRGGPLWSEGHTEGKYRKCDSIRLAFRRLQAKTKITKPFKSLKKTSASMLKNNAQYSGLTWLFLGHAPRNVDDRNYTKRPQELLDLAVTWLGQEYGLVERPEPAKSEKPEAKPSDPAPAPEPDAAEPAPNQGPSHAGRRSKTAKRRPAASGRPKADAVPGA